MNVQNKSQIKRILNKGLEEYNKYRTPEVVATLKKLNENSFGVEFRGTFCTTCGFYDYFDDLKYELEDLGLFVDIEKIEEFEEGAFVEFVIKEAKVNFEK